MATSPAPATGATPVALEALRAGTPEDEIKYREAKSKGGKPVFRDGHPLMLAYVDARYVMDTLDNTVGAANWRADFRPSASAKPGAVQCDLSIRVDGEWITKSDVGTPSTIEPDKGAYSDALKRAGVHWGIARDLYEEREDDGPADEQSERANSMRDERRGRPIQQRVRGGGAYEDEDEEEEAPRRPARTSAPARGGGGGGRQFRPQRDDDNGDALYENFDPNDSPWYCPTHDAVKAVKGGVSSRTGKKYGPFLACDVSGCDERGPFLDAATRR